VDDAPSVFVTSHYGRWAHMDNDGNGGGGWAWVPPHREANHDEREYRPVYSPALVTFVGDSNSSRDFGNGGGVAWFPLAPGEVYMPYYRGSRGYVERLNVTNTVVNVTKVTNVYNVYNSNQRNVTNITYVNQRVNNGVTVVSRDTFINARPVARNLGHVDTRQIAEAPVERGVAVQPVRASVLGAGTPARFRPPQAIINRQVVATQRPAPPKQPFEQRQAATNVRTVQPVPPQPLVDQSKNNQANGRPVARPQEPLRPAETQQASPMGMPRPDARPQRPIATPREAEPMRAEAPAVPRPPQARDNQARGNENRGNENRGNETRDNENNRFSQGWSHPQAKPVPPVQQKNAAQAREDENKFRNWQQQRQQSAPAQNRAAQEQHQQPRQQEPHKQENKPPRPPSPN